MPSNTERLYEAINHYGYNNLRGVVDGLAREINTNSGGKYTPFINGLRREITEDQRTVGWGLRSGNILERLDGDLGNSQTRERLSTAIRNNPQGVADMMDRYDRGQISLNQGLAQIERSYPQAPAAPNRGNAGTQPRGGNTMRTFTDEVNDFNRGQNSTNDEELFLRQKIERDQASGRGRTNTEIAEERALMRRLGARGDQLTAAERATIHPATTARSPAGPATALPASAGTASPQPAVAAAAPAPDAAAPASPGAIRLPDQITSQNYDDLKETLVDGIRTSMPELVQNGMLAGFEARLNDPAFKQQFMNQYNNDPVFRQRFQGAFSNLTTIGASANESGGMASIMGNFVDIDGMRNRLKGQVREFVANPDYLLSADRVEQLRQDTNAAAHPFGAVMQGIGRMFGFEGPADWSQLLDGIKQFFQNFMSGNGGGFDIAGMFGSAGNSGGNMFAGLMQGAREMFGGAGAGSGAPAPTALANNTNATNPNTPNLAMGMTPGAPTTIVSTPS